MRILLVDDEPVYIKSLGRLLRNHGFEVEGASCGQEALKIFKKHRFDLVITDACMEKGCGIELTENLRHANHQIPVLIHTGCPFEAAKGLNAGACEVLKKPAPLESVLRAVHTWLPHKEAA